MRSDRFWAAARLAAVGGWLDDRQGLQLLRRRYLRHYQNNSCTALKWPLKQPQH